MPNTLGHRGYAGGLGPNNLDIELPKTAAAVGNDTIWIDAETKLRSNNDMTFDLNKCKIFVEKASIYV